MGIIENAKTFLVNVAIKKGVSNAIKVAAAWLLSKAALDGAGIDSATAELVTTAIVTGVLEFIRNLIKQKMPSIGKYL